MRSLKLTAIVQARMSSERLPGKILKNINGKPLLSYIMERLLKCKVVDKIIIATSVEKSDDAVETFCSEKKYSCFRGSLNNVAERFKEIIERNNLKAFLRVCGDSPLLDINLIQKGIKCYNENNFDIVTNTLNRSFPKGQSIEIVNAGSFINAYAKIETTLEYYEHVTKYFYKNPDEFKIHNISSGENAGNIQLSVDTVEDMNLIEKIIKQMKKPHWEYTWKEVLKIREEVLK